ncbi:hypothetical protein LRQ11_27720, partial [Pseudomonas sp. MAFF 311095]
MLAVPPPSQPRWGSTAPSLNVGHALPGSYDWRMTNRMSLVHAFIPLTVGGTSMSIAAFLRT